VSHNSTTRFANKVENYIKYRPHYPSAIIDYMKSENILMNNSIIADIGSGTGISSELFLKNGYGYIVYGIEPNKEMREAGERLLRDHKNFHSIDGTAEETALADRSIDIIIAGQAFHWFDAEKTRVEFKRILKPGGSVILMWNERKLSSTPFLKDYENMLLKFGTDYNEIRHENTDEKVFDKFFSDYKIKYFDNEQVFDFNGVKGRLLSSSYIPAETDPYYLPMLDNLKEIYDKHNIKGKVTIEYNTKIVAGNL